MKDNLTIYNTVRNPPKEALKPIKGGRLSGYTDINPMWRKALTTIWCGMVGNTIKAMDTGANGGSRISNLFIHKS